MKLPRSSHTAFTSLSGTIILHRKTTCFWYEKTGMEYIPVSIKALMNERRTTLLGGSSFTHYSIMSAVQKSILRFFPKNSFRDDPCSHGKHQTEIAKGCGIELDHTIDFQDKTTHIECQKQDQES